MANRKRSAITAFAQMQRASKKAAAGVPRKGIKVKRTAKAVKQNADGEHKTVNKTLNLTATQLRPPNVRSGGFIGQEIKHFDQALVIFSDGTANTSSTEMTNIVMPAIGDKSSERDGRDLVIKGMSVRVLFSSDSVAAKGGPIHDANLRLFGVVDKQHNRSGTSPIRSEIFDVVNYSAGEIPWTVLNRELDGTARYQTFMDQVISIPSATFVDTTGASYGANGKWHNFDLFLNDLNIPVRFGKGTTTGVQSAVEQNSFYITAVLDQSDATQGTVYPTLEVRANVRTTFVG